MTTTTPTSMTLQQIRIARQEASRWFNAGGAGVPSHLLDSADTWFPEGPAIAGLLRCFDRSPLLSLSGRSLSGLGRYDQSMQPPIRGKFPLIRYLLDDVAFRLFPIRAWAAPADNQQVAAVCLWRLPSTFERLDGDSNARHRVDADARRALIERISRLPEPSALVEAGPEVAAVWRLETPLPMDAGLALHEQLALLHGGDRRPAPGDTLFSIPVAGPVRNWNGLQPDYTVISLGDPARFYTPAELLLEV